MLKLRGQIGPIGLKRLGRKNLPGISHGAVMRRNGPVGWARHGNGPEVSGGELRPFYILGLRHWGSDGQTGHALI